MKHTLHTTALACALALGTSVASAAALDDTQVKYSGYIKTDALISNYSDGTIPTGSVGRDFYIPTLTPVGQADEGTQFDAHIRQSRFRFATATPTASGDAIKGVLELDFIVTTGGNERISNSYQPRVRHAYLEYQNWLVGQTWTTMMDVSILPESLDFIGITDGITFGRQTMVRYTNGGLQLALENPESTISPQGGNGRIVADDNALPDLIAAYQVDGDWGHVKVAGLLRQLSYDNGTTVDDDETSFGMAISSKINFANGDDVRMMANAGTGMGRYTALNNANGAVINPEGGNIEAIDSYGYAISYRHVWSAKARSTVMMSAMEIDNDTALTGFDVTQRSYSARVNYLYSPVNALTVGVEYGFAKREVESGLSGDMNRLQFSAKYAF